MTTRTFQNTESKSAPWNLSGIPAEDSLGPSKVTNSSKPTWPSPDEEGRNSDLSPCIAHVEAGRCLSATGWLMQKEDGQTYHLYQVFGWWPPAPPHWACSPVSAWPSPTPASRWSRFHLGQTLWMPHGSLFGKRRALFMWREHRKEASEKKHTCTQFHTKQQQTGSTQYV